MNTIRRVMTCLAEGATGKDVDLVSFPCQRPRQFGHMGGNSSNGDGVQ
jgi:hypothetical protein